MTNGLSNESRGRQDSFYLFGCSTMSIFFPIRECMEVRKYQRMDINGFNVVLVKFSFPESLKTTGLDGSLDW